MITGDQIAAKALTQAGKKYVYGAEVRLDNPNPKALDCSELVEWVCAQLGVKPKMPDGAIYQYQHCRNHDTLTTLKEAMQIRGALLFRVNHPGLGNHVAVSLGNGMTIEARGKAYGVGSWKAAGRTWTAAALIPGVTYQEANK